LTFPLHLEPQGKLLVQAASSAIGLHQIETGFANASSGYSLVMIGAFGAPQSILLHVMSLRQLMRRKRNERE
jgi:hypothetical protein